jgi:hypothetical protein
MAELQLGHRRFLGLPALAAEASGAKAQDQLTLYVGTEVPTS